MDHPSIDPWRELRQCEVKVSEGDPHSPTKPSSCSWRSQEVGQYEARGLGLHTVDPEISTAGVVLVAAIQQLEVVGLRVKRLFNRRSDTADKPVNTL